MDLKKFFIEFQDHLAPKLDTYEQAIYLYLFRHSHLNGANETVISTRSSRTRMAMGIGKAGSSMAENKCREKLRSLEQKGCISILGVVRNGTRVHLRLPNEIEGVVQIGNDDSIVLLEDMDFFDNTENRKLILEREQHRCFYCLCNLDGTNHVIEHVVSRPDGDNSYRNVVAACITCNNRKGASGAEDFMRTLYRDNFLSKEEFSVRCDHLRRLKEGELKPQIS